MPYNEEISARQTAVKVASEAMQATLSKFEEPKDIDDIVDRIIEVADEKIVPFILHGKGGAASPSDDTLLYVAVSKKNKNPEEYAEAFRKYDFREGSKGGYWANIPASELFKMFNEYRGIDKELRFTIQKSERGEK